MRFYVLLPRQYSKGLVAIILAAGPFIYLTCRQSEDNCIIQVYWLTTCSANLVPDGSILLTAMHSLHRKSQRCGLKFPAKSDPTVPLPLVLIWVPLAHLALCAESSSWKLDQGRAFRSGLIPQSPLGVTFIAECGPLFFLQVNQALKALACGT